MRKFWVVMMFGALLVGCGPSEPPGPSQAEIGQCMRFNQSKYDDYAASEATERARLDAAIERANRAREATNSAFLTGRYSPPAYQGDENVTATCREYVLGCAEPSKFKRECTANITFIWYPN